MSQRDPVRDLNNYLQSYPGHNLTPLLSWSTWSEGPQHQLTHHAAANFEGQRIGYGFGVAKGIAKAQAATQALGYIRQVYPYY